MRALSFTLFVFVAVGCADPVHDQAVSALGGEAPGVGPGPMHRPGEPCLTCHGGEGPANFVMAFGGTVFAHLTNSVAVSGASVRVLDASKRTYETTTNCVGNFWIPAKEFEPVYPVRAAVTFQGQERVMRTEMHTDGSCAACHSKPEDSDSPGQVWILPDAIPASPPRCN